jgi:hypothetical protein
VWITGHKVWVDMMKRLQKGMYEEEVEEMSWAQRKDIRNWPGLGDVLKRTVWPSGQVGTGNAATDVFTSIMRVDERLPWLAEGKAILPVHVAVV